AASRGEERTLHITSHAFRFAQTLQQRAVRFDLAAHADLLCRAQLALHETEDAEDLDGPNVDREIAAPIAAVLAGERVSIRRRVYTLVVSTARSFISGNRAQLPDLGCGLRGFRGDDSAHQAFVDLDFHRQAPRPPLHEAAAQRVPMLRAQRRILKLFSFPRDFSLDERIATTETSQVSQGGNTLYECAFGGRSSPRCGLHADDACAFRGLALRLQATALVRHSTGGLGSANQSGHDAAPRSLLGAPTLFPRGQARERDLARAAAGILRRRAVRGENLRASAN